MWQQVKLVSCSTSSPQTSSFRSFHISINITNPQRSGRRIAIISSFHSLGRIESLALPWLLLRVSFSRDSSRMEYLLSGLGNKIGQRNKKLAGGLILQPIFVYLVFAFSLGLGFAFAFFPAFFPFAPLL